MRQRERRRSSVRSDRRRYHRPVRGSRLRPRPLDPAYAYDAGTWNILRQTVQTLVRTPRGGGQPVPEAASDCRFTDTGNESYRCTLRPGLKFASGDPVTAKDVKFSIDRVRAIKDENGPSALLSTLDTVETKGTDTVVFHLKTADATFPYKLATPATGIVSEKSYEAKKLRPGFTVDGSGPYTMKAEVKDNHLVRAVFTKNPNYKGDIKLQNDKVELRTFDDSATMGKALTDGKIHVVSRTLSPAQITEFAKTPPRASSSPRCPAWRSATSASTPTRRPSTTRRSARPSPPPSTATT